MGNKTGILSPGGGERHRICGQDIDQCPANLTLTQHIHMLSTQHIHMDEQIKTKLFGTKSPNLGKQEFLTEIGQRQFSLLMVPYLHAKNQNDSWTSF